MNKISEWKDIILTLGGIALFCWIALTWLDENNKSKEAELSKKLDNTCSVILNEQPNNLELYDLCWNMGMQQFNNGN